MSCAIDVNILLYASDRESPFAQRAQELMSQLASGPEPFCIAWPTVMAYLRIATHAAVFLHPLTPDEAIGNIESLLKLPHVRMLAEEEGFWEIYRQLAREFPIRGNLVPDAHLAALLRLHGVSTLYSNDRDFRKFDFLKVRNPFGNLRKD